MVTNSRRIQSRNHTFGSQNIVADALSFLEKIDNLNNQNKIIIKLESTLESLSENFAFNKKNNLHPTSFKMIMRFQQRDKSLIEIANEKPNDYSIKHFRGAGKTYSLICKHRKIVIPKQI